MADTLASILNPVASATGTAPSKTAGVTTKTTNDAATMAKNFDSFLTLLTTQLKNQNPLEPLDTISSPSSSCSSPRSSSR